MRLELRRSGGIAGPIVRRPVVLETDQLQAHERERVDHAIAAARARGSDPPGLPLRGADLLQYHLRIEDPHGSVTDGRAETLAFSDPVDDSALGSLVDLITELGKEQTDG